MIEIILNGDPHRIEAGSSLILLLQNLKLDPLKLAVERNLEIVPKTTYQNIILLDGDHLEIVHFIGGGNIRVSYDNTKK